MNEYLEKIIAAKKKRIEKLNLTDLIKAVDTKKKSCNSLAVILENAINPIIIAEIKKASPSRGLICPDFNFDKILFEYSKNFRVDAISILTEEDFFLGKLEYVEQAVLKTDKPILRKDFIFSEAQVYETKKSGAGIMLLIAAILSEKDYKFLYDLGKSLYLDIITEVHNQNELKMVNAYNPEIIGVNNRNLNTFEVSLTISEELIKQKTTDSFYISESGIKTSDDIKKLYRAGYRGFLIGETIMREKNINNTLKELVDITTI